MGELLALDPTGARARMLLAARSAPVAIGGFALSLVAFAVLLPLAPDLAPLTLVASLAMAVGLLAMGPGFAELSFEGAPRATTAVGTFGAIAGLAAAALAAATLGARGPVPGLGLAFAALGLWLVMANALAAATRGFPRAFAALGVVAGVGFAVGGLFAEPGGPAAALLVSGALTLVGFPAWAWAARSALRGAAGAAGTQG